MVAVPAAVASLSTYQWELIFTQLSFEGGIGLVQFVDLCLRIRQEGDGYVRELERRQEEKRMRDEEGQRATRPDTFNGLSVKGSEFKAKQIQTQKRAVDQEMASELRRRQRAIQNSSLKSQSNMLGELSAYSRKVSGRTSNMINYAAPRTSNMINYAAPTGFRRSSVRATDKGDDGAAATEAIDATKE